MSQILFYNNAATTLAGAITSTATTANLAASTGALFSPGPASGQYFVATLVDAATGLFNEIVHVTNVTGDVVTMVRAQESTTALNWNAGDFFQNFNTAGTMAAMVQSSLICPAYPGPAQNGGFAGSAPGSVKTATFTANSLCAAAALNGTTYLGTSLSLSFNGATTGADGMDTGGTPTAGDLSIYAIYNPATNTWATLGTLGATSHGPIYAGSHMPAGYTASCLIWAGVTDGSGNVPIFSQVGRAIWPANTNVLSNGGATSPASISLSAVVPAAATSCDGNIATGGGGATVNVLSSTSLSGPLRALSGNGISGGFSGLPILTAQTIYYSVSANTASISIESYTI